jgi:hypothetical protein
MVTFPFQIAGDFRDFGMPQARVVAVRLDHEVS